MKIYELGSDLKNYSHFFQDYPYPTGESSIIGKAMEQRWKPFGKEYKQITLDLASDEFGRKNYKFDFSGFLGTFFVISQKMLDKMEHVLSCRGEVLPVTTRSKRKKFFGYYPTNALSGCLDKDNSEYNEYPKGLIIEKIVLLKNKISDDYLFSIEEDISRVFVTEKFKALVEKFDLQGFDFSKEVELS